MIQVAHVLGRDAQRDHDLGERVALLQPLEHERRELALRHLRCAHHGLLRVARRALLRLQLLRESLDIGCFEAAHALVVDQRVQPRAFETAHGRDADIEALGDVIARERRQFQLVIALFRGYARRNTRASAPEIDNLTL